MGTVYRSPLDCLCTGWCDLLAGVAPGMCGDLSTGGGFELRDLLSGSMVGVAYKHMVHHTPVVSLLL